jgi:hypothetical protein
VFCLCRTFHFTLHTLQPFTHQLILTAPLPLLPSPKRLNFHSSLSLRFIYTAMKQNVWLYLVETRGFNVDRHLA